MKSALLSVALLVIASAGVPEGRRDLVTGTLRRTRNLGTRRPPEEIKAVIEWAD